MKYYLNIFVKGGVFLLIFFLSYQTLSYNTGLAFILIPFCICSILFPYYGLLVFPILLFYQDFLACILCGFLWGLQLTLKPFFLKNKKSLFLFLVLTSIITNLIYGQLYYVKPLFLLLTIGIFGAFYGGFLYTMEFYLPNKKALIKIHNYPFFIALFILNMSIGALNLSYGFFFFACFVIFLSMIKQSMISFSLAIIVLFFRETYTLILPAVSIAFLYPPLGIALSFSYIIVNLFVNIISSDILLYLELSCLWACLFYFYVNQNIVFNSHEFSIYHNLTMNFNDQILKFASFLDEFQRTFINNINSKPQLSDAFMILVNSFCSHCPKKKDCFFKNKNETYAFLRDALIFGNDLRIEKSTSHMKEQIKNCLFSSDVLNRAHSLKNKYNLSHFRNNKERNLITQITGVSNTLRQYAIDLSMKQETNLEIYLSLRHHILNYGYSLTLFNIRKYFKNDFWIEIGVYNCSLCEVNEVIKPLADKILKQETSIIVKKNLNDSLYFSILPKNHYNILYGHGSLAKNDLNISGDNYMVKDIENGLFLAAISDGMGSGYRAYNESKSTLEMLDKITNFEINSQTSINMLNTFYSLKDSMEYYATLDMIEINKTNGKAFLYKMGSSDTIWFSDGQLKVINNTSLPVGINELISFETINIKHNDIILLMSDGVRDAISNEELKDILLFSQTKHPQKICYDILNTVLSSTNQKANDDMSLITLKVEKKVS